MQQLFSTEILSYIKIYGPQSPALSAPYFFALE